MRKIRIGVTAVLLLGVLVTTAAPAGSQEVPDTRIETRMITGGFLLIPENIQHLPYLPVVPLGQLNFEVGLHEVRPHGIRALVGRDVFFSAGGFPICHAVTNIYGRAKCPVLLGGQPGVLLALITGQALAEYRGNELYKPTSIAVPAVGPWLPPGECGFIC